MHCIHKKNVTLGFDTRAIELTLSKGEIEKFRVLIFIWRMEMTILKKYFHISSPLQLPLRHYSIEVTRRQFTNIQFLSDNSFITGRHFRPPLESNGRARPTVSTCSSWKWFVRVLELKTMQNEKQFRLHPLPTQRFLKGQFHWNFKLISYLERTPEKLWTLILHKKGMHKNQKIFTCSDACERKPTGTCGSRNDCSVWRLH